MSTNFMAQGFASPEWIICGMQLPEEYPTPEGHPKYRVRIVASKSLRRADLHASFSYQDIYSGGIFSPVGLTPDATVLTDASYTLTTVMDNLIIIDGSSYGACLKHLFETWSPEPREERAIELKQLGIEGSTSTPAIGSLRVSHQ